MSKPHEAVMLVNYKVLREMLRLPSDIQIVDVNYHDDETCELVLRGRTLPKTGEVTAEYTYEHTTNIKFVRFAGV